MAKMNEAIIRYADESDVEALCDLYFEFHNFHALHLPDYLRSLDGTSPEVRGELRQSIKEVIQGDDSAMLVADVAGRVVGMAEIYLKPPDLTNPAALPMHSAYLQSLGVSQDLWRLGIGEKLVKAAEDWARQRGATEMSLDSWEFSAGPLAFYEKLGYHTLRRKLVRALNTPDLES